MNVQEFYFVGGIEKQHELQVFNDRIQLPLNWAPGMIGILPVFEDEESAKEYAGDYYIVYRIQAEKI